MRAAASTQTLGAFILRMKKTSNETKIVSGVAWYHPEQWQRLREVSEDVDNLEETYDAWLKTAERLIRDFPLTGTGMGTFGAAIMAYQTAEPGYTIGQAHNHYLQLAAEGGALVTVPVVLSAMGLMVLFVRRLAEDQSGTALIRSGAAAGLTGALLQSFWETGLRMPANAMLFAVLAAVATHTPAPVDRTAD